MTSLLYILYTHCHIENMFLGVDTHQSVFYISRSLILRGHWRLGRYFGSIVGLTPDKSATRHKNTERQTQASTFAFTPLGSLGFSVSLASFGLWEESRETSREPMQVKGRAGKETTQNPQEMNPQLAVGCSPLQHHFSKQQFNDKWKVGAERQKQLRVFAETRFV